MKRYELKMVLDADDSFVDKLINELQGDIKELLNRYYHTDLVSSNFKVVS